ncbi:MAG: Eco57I restriction-modification methylase domain-containing protein, partial [Planctomycetota bacterium]
LLSRRSVYCSKTANGKYSVCESFNNPEGNIRFGRVEHAWENGRCVYCGASKDAYDRGPELETHAYRFLHADKPEEVFSMKFDVIVGNPPYQMGSDGGTRDIPIYNKFVDQAKKLNPRFLSMIIPSRWMASGLGLSEFRRTMLEDRRIRKLVDYERMDEVFPGVDFEGGVCFFLWDRDNEGRCAVSSISGDEIIGPVERDLSEYDVFVRDSRALDILHKVRSKGGTSITDILSVDKEFGWTSNFDGFHQKQKPGDVALHYNRKGKRLIGWIARKDVTKSANLIDTWKVMVPQAYGERGTRPATVLGPSFVARSPSVCTQTYLFFYVGSKAQADSLNSYLRTRFFRFLVSLRKITQHATRSTYTWVPQQAWDRTWTDQELYKKYRLSKDDIAFIEARVRAMDASDE